jgi:hypothetical protein
MKLSKEDLRKLIENSYIEPFLTEKNSEDPCACEACVPINNPPLGFVGLMGWICPKCGAVMSPYTDFCPNCTKRNFEITCSSSTGTPAKQLGFASNTQVTEKENNI